MYDANGCLSYYPIEEEHFRVVRRNKSQRGELPMLVNLGNKQAASEAEEAENKASNNNNKKIYTSPKSVLYDFIAKLVCEAGASGDGKISARSSRQLERLVVACVQEAAKDILHAALEKYAAFDKQSAIDYEPVKSLQSPERVTSANITATVAVTPLQAEVLTVVDEEDDPIVVEEGTTNTTDDFILELKEEVVLQTLLHKRMFEKKKRVFQLEHRNGRRLLVVLPPDAVTAASFQEEATRTNWVKTMLNTQERVEGMLAHLAKYYPDLAVLHRRTEATLVNPIG
jgi:hypothetical protein